ncbi:MAG: SIR2 family protein [Chitinophagaceae bacterium]|nr:SIR2 family protein [Chitinophagaceae bacterium]
MNFGSMLNQSLQETIDINYNKTPALVIGNGINRISNNNLSWDGVLDKLIQVSGSEQIRKGNKPLTFLFEEILHNMKGGATRKNEEKLKKFVREAIEENLLPNDLHKKFVNLNIQHFFTTNYDYCLEKSIDPDFKKTERQKQEGESKKYSLNRCNKIKGKNIWHIHGELDNSLINERNNYKEKSIMLGFDQYMGTLMDMSQLMNYGSYRNLSGKPTLEEVFSKLLNIQTTERSWVSFFFTNDIHIIALDLGTFETHLWWLMQYRKKLAARKGFAYKNKIFYYVSFYERLLKRDQLELLQSFGVNIVEVQCAFNEGNFYREFYEKVNELISASL